jgi:hypothetical protein
MPALIRGLRWLGQKIATHISNLVGASVSGAEWQTLTGERRALLPTPLCLISIAGIVVCLQAATVC